MELSEVQTAELLREYDVPLPICGIADSPNAARDLCAEIGGRSWVVKAGLKPDERVALEPRIECTSPDAVGRAAAALLGQTIEVAGTEGERVLDRVMVESVGEVTAEWYLGLALDRVSHRIVLIGSTLAGQAVDDIARKAGSAVARESVDPFLGLQPFQSRRFFLALGLPPELLPAATTALACLYRAFADLEATAVEVSRFNLEGSVLVARDVTVLFDHGAFYRNPRLRGLIEQADGGRPDAVAAEWDLRHVSMNGTVGVIVSGAGLGAATTDLLAVAGLTPSGVVDLGTGATAEAVVAALQLVLARPGVRCVLLNVFAGFDRCDHVAEGIVRTMKGGEVALPVVVRLNGTKVRDGLSLLRESGVAVSYTTSLDEAVAMVVDSCSDGDGGQR